MSTRRRRGQAGDATPRELPNILYSDSDDEASQMIAVSRQCRHEHILTHTQMPEHTQTHSETEPAKYQCTSAGHRRAAKSTRERTHSHTKLAANVHTLAHTHSATLTAALYYNDFWGALSKSQRR